MGNDGGSIPYRRDLVKAKPKAEQKDEKSVQRALWGTCALSKEPLKEPIVADPLGKLYNKDAVIEFLLDRTTYGDGDKICGYVKGVKDLLTLVLTPNPSAAPATAAPTTARPDLDLPLRARYICPLTMKEMSGSLPFVALRSCGCVFSEAGLRSVVSAESGKEGPITPPASDGEQDGKAAPRTTMACPNCGKPFDPAGGEKGRTAWLPLNPRAEVQEALLAQLLADRAAAKLAKADKGGKKRKAAAVGTDAPDAQAPPATTTPSEHKRAKTSAPAPAAASQSHLSSKVAAQLAELEAKRKESGMSSAVQSIYAGKGEQGRGSGNDFFTRTFTRYA